MADSKNQPASADAPAPAADQPAAVNPVSPAVPTNVAAEGPAPAGDPIKSDSSLWDRLKAKAPHLTREHASKHGMDDDMLERIARGEEPPPPYNGPDESATDLHLTSGGWQNTPAGVAPEDVGRDKIGR